MNALYNNVFTVWVVFVSTLAWLSRSPNRFTRPMFVRVFIDYFDGDFRKHGKRVFQEHYDMVRALVPKENLLEYHVKDGWAPLCNFLGEEVPHSEFPSGNDREETEQRIKALVDSEVLRLGKYALFVLAYSIIIYALFKKRLLLTSICLPTCI